MFESGRKDCEIGRVARPTEDCWFSSKIITKQSYAEDVYVAYQDRHTPFNFGFAARKRASLVTVLSNLDPPAAQQVSMFINSRLPK
jgi:hypothetical protein